MRKAKAFLARVLAAAVMITSVLPSGALTANAADVRLSEEGWKVQKIDKEKGNVWSVEDFDDYKNLDGIQTWQLESKDGDENYNTDLSKDSRPAVVYAKNIDITSDYKAGSPNRVISFDVLPKHDLKMTSGSTAAQMCFGVYLKYVDATHWVYLGTEGGNGWFLEWNDGTSPSQPYKNLSGVHQQFTFTDDEYHRIIIEYVSKSQIQLTLWKMAKEDPEDPECKNWITTGAPTEKLIGDDDFKGTNMLKEIEDYALSTQARSTSPQARSTTPESPTPPSPTPESPTPPSPTPESPTPPGPTPEQTSKPIHFGFKAATRLVQDSDPIYTNVDVANIETNESANSSKMVPLSYKDCGWESPRANRKASDIIKPHSDGGINYVGIDASETDNNTKTVYYRNTALDDLSEGSLSVIFRPDTSAGKSEEDVTGAFYFNARSTASQNAQSLTAESPSGSVQVGFNGTSWGYKLNGGQFVPAQGDAPKYAHEYKLDMTFDAENKFSAEVIEVVRNGNEDDRYEEIYLKNDFSINADGAQKITIADAVSLENTGVSEAGNISITAANGLFLYFRNVNYAKAVYQSAAEYLGTPYTTVMGRNNNDHTFYTAAWDAFAGIRTEKSNILNADGVIATPQAASALKSMEDAWAALDVDDNKIAPDIAKLVAAKADLAAKKDKNYYEYDEAKFSAAESALENAHTLLTTTPGDATKEQVTGALDKYNALSITPVAPSSTDKDALNKTITDAKAGVDAADKEFYDNWDAYEEALENAEALVADPTATKKDIYDAIKALEEAKDALSLKSADQADKDALKASIAAIEADVAQQNLQPDAAYNAALQAAKDLANGSAATTKKALADALKKLEAAKNALSKKAVTPAVTLKAGQTADVNSNQYTVLDPNAKTVVLTKSLLDKKKAKKLTIPATVPVNGVNCTVVSIGKNAFKGYNKLTSVVIPETVTKIEANAFSGCKKLKKVQIKNANINIAKKAFKGAPSKATVKVPKALKKNAKAKKKFQTMLKKAGLKNAKIK